MDKSLLLLPSAGLRQGRWATDAEGNCELGVLIRN